MRLPLVPLQSLLTLMGIIYCDGKGVVKLMVGVGSDAVLPCALGTEENIEFILFFWTKDSRQHVFLYDAGLHYNNGRPGQDQQFRGRVSHFPEELKHGNASVVIRGTKVADSGNYTCDFPRLQPQRQIFQFELVVVVSAKPKVAILNITKARALLHCEVPGAFPTPHVHWQDSDGHPLPAEDLHVSGSGRPPTVTLQTAVTQSGLYSCVASQEGVDGRAEARLHVEICGDGGQEGSALFYSLYAALFLSSLALAVMCLLRIRDRARNAGQTAKVQQKVNELLSKSMHFSESPTRRHTSSRQASSCSSNPGTVYHQLSTSTQARPNDAPTSSRQASPSSSDLDLDNPDPNTYVQPDAGPADGGERPSAIPQGEHTSSSD